MLIYIFPLFFRIVSQTILFLEFSNHTPMNYAFYKNTQSKNLLLQKRINFIVFFFICESMFRTSWFENMSSLKATLYLKDRVLQLSIFDKIPRTKYMLFMSH